MVLGQVERTLHVLMARPMRRAPPLVHLPHACLGSDSKTKLSQNKSDLVTGKKPRVKSVPWVKLVTSVCVYCEQNHYASAGAVGNPGLFLAQLEQ